MATVEAINSTSAATATTPGAKRLRQAVDQVVGLTFYGTLLRSMRSSTMQGEYGHGGRGEEVFQAQLDQLLATEAGQARSYSLTNAVVSRLIDQQAFMDRQLGRDGGEA